MAGAEGCSAMYCLDRLFCRPITTAELPAEGAVAAWLEPRMIIGLAGVLCRGLGRLTRAALGIG